MKQENVSGDGRQSGPDYDRMLPTPTTWLQRQAKSVSRSSSSKPRRGRLRSARVSVPGVIERQECLLEFTSSTLNICTLTSTGGLQLLASVATTDLIGVYPVGVRCVNVLDRSNRLWTFTDFEGSVHQRGFVRTATAVLNNRTLASDDWSEGTRLTARVAIGMTDSIDPRPATLILTRDRLRFDHAGNELLPTQLDLSNDEAVCEVTPGNQPWLLTLTSPLWPRRDQANGYTLELLDQEAADTIRPRLVEALPALITAARQRKRHLEEEERAAALRATEAERLRRSPPPPPRLIRDARDAELVAAEWLGWWDGEDGVVSPVGPDAGVDVYTTRSIGQVKRGAVPTGAPALQQLLGVAVAHDKRPVFFTLAGYTTAARRWAEAVNMPLFQFDLQGLPAPVNAAARDLARSRAD